MVHSPDEPPHVRDPDRDLKKDVDPNQMYDGNKVFLEWSMVSAEVSNLKKDLIRWKEKVCTFAIKFISKRYNFSSDNISKIVCISSLYNSFFTQNFIFFWKKTVEF